MDSQFELYFTLIEGMAITMMRSIWYTDSSVSFHMTGCRQFFNDLEEKYLDIHIEFGDDVRYNYTWIVTVTFKRKPGSPLHIKDSMFMLGIILRGE